MEAGASSRKWEYRAEGCAVRAFASAGEPGRILLVSKKTELVEGRSGVSDDEADAVKRLDVEIWTREHPEYASKATHLERREWFTRKVLEPLLRETGVLMTGDLVDLREVDFDADDTSLGLFLPDALALGHLLRDSGEGNAVAGDTMSFEFKPKSAATPGPGALIDPRHAHKVAHTEHELQQRHKMWKGKIEALSRYEPRDFFAKGAATAQGSAREIETSKQRALQGLFDCPQNNLIVYKNAVKIFPAEGASHATIEEAANLSMDDIIGALARALTQQQAALDAISSLQVRTTPAPRASSLTFSRLSLGSLTHPYFSIRMNRRGTFTALRAFTGSTTASCASLVPLTRQRKTRISPQSRRRMRRESESCGSCRGAPVCKPWKTT